MKDIKKNILLIGSLPYAQKKISSLGYKITLALSKEELKFGTKGIELANQTWVYESDNYKDLIKKMHHMHKEEPFDGVISFTERGLYIAANLAEKLDLPGFQIDTVNKIFNKYTVRKELEKFKEANIKYQLCKNVNDAVNFFKSIDNSIILKPINGMGSKGVTIVQELQNIESAFEYSSDSGKLPVLAEVYIEGTDFSVETFTCNGKHQLLSITDKNNTGPPHFVGTFHSMPSIILKSKHEKIFKTVKKCLDILGVYFGPAHTEVKVIGDNVKIIETQLRPGGRFYHLMEKGLGIDIFEMTVKGLFNEAYHPKKGAGAAAIYYLKSKDIGIVDKIEGVDEVEKNAKVCDLHIRVKVGDEIHPLENSLHRLGHIICIDDTPEKALHNAKSLIENIKVIVRPKK